MNKLFQMRGGYEWLFIPFKGEEFLVEVKLPDPTQLPEIETLRFLTDKQKKKALPGRKLFIFYIYKKNAAK